MSMTVKFWGVRGLLPAAPPPILIMNDFRSLLLQFFAEGYSQRKEVDLFLGKQKLTSVGGYGSSSTCIELSDSQGQLIINAGSGIKRLGDQMMKSRSLNKTSKSFHILFTNFNFDHLLGLPFFTPLFIPGNEIHFYSTQSNLKEALQFVFTRPFFPVEFTMLPSNINFHTLSPEMTTKIENFEVSTHSKKQNNYGSGFKIKSDKGTYAHINDFEDLSIKDNFFNNTDLIYYDAQTLLPDSQAPFRAIDLAYGQNIKRILFGHHDPDMNTSKLQTLEKSIQSYVISKIKDFSQNSKTLHPVQWSFAFEEQTIEL